MAGQLEDLRSAMTASDWARALPIALDAWREHRVPALADLVDAIAARCDIAPPHNRTLHAWWMAHATPYDPFAVHALAKHFRTRGRVVRFRELLEKWPVTNPVTAALKDTVPTWWHPWSTGPINHLDRLAAMTAWPDDPRSSAILARAIALPETLYRAGEVAIVELIGAWLERLGDVRVVPELARRVAQPYDRDRAARLRRTIEALEAMAAARRPSAELARELAELAALVPPAPPTRDLAPLWDEVAAHPDDVGPRLILGDALVEAGDLRGEVIVLQCNAKQAHRPLRSAHRDRSDGRVRTIARLEWERWLGDIALLLARRGCRMHNGMLEVVQVGRGETPSWAWDKVRGHRELACVHTVRPGHVAPNNYARFVAALARPPRSLGLTHHTQAAALAEEIPHLGTATLEYDHASMRQPAEQVPPLAGTFDTLARVVPALEELVFHDVCNRDQLTELAGRLPEMFPALRRIRIKASLVMSPHVKNLPLVEIVP